MKNVTRQSIKHLVALLGLTAVLAMAGQSLAAKQPPSSPIDVNTASVAQLTQIPGVGASKAQAIVTAREKAPFTSAHDLAGVKGFGEKLYAKVAPYVTVGGATNNQAPGTAGKAAQ